MPAPLRLVWIAAFLLAAAPTSVERARAVEMDPGSTAQARSRLLACDSADVMLEVLTSNDAHTMPNGTIRGTRTSEVLALGHNGSEWVRRFADALLPAGREWKARVTPALEVERADGRDPWTVHVHAYARGEAQAFWVVNLLDGWAGQGLDPVSVFDFLGSPDSLRAVLTSGMQPSSDGAKRLRNLREPDAAIVPLPERMRR